MGEAIGQILAFGLAVGLSPVPIIGVTLMLATPRAGPNGLAFLAGWVLGLTTIGAIVLLISSGAEASDQGAPADWVSVFKVALGVLVLAEALKQWRGRPQPGQEAQLPAWMEKTDSFTSPKAAGFGILLSALNPKNLLLVAAAGAAIAQTGVSTGEQAVALSVFVIVGTLGTGLPVALYFALGERSRPILDEIRGWMAQNNTTIMTVLFLIIGAKLLGDGISGL